MPRRARQCPPGYVYRVLNRGVGRMALFDVEQDYAAFERVLMRTLERVSEGLAVMSVPDTMAHG